ncbi:MAG TPA: hypothetical protein VFT99_09410, partial [Roseiflexaceae bacterium]|nr:hypothetical protein [Roseiflexaceae bacterium]
SSQLRSVMADTALDKKLRRHVLALATGTAPEAAAPSAETNTVAPVDDVPEVPVSESDDAPVTATTEDEAKS